MDNPDNYENVRNMDDGQTTDISIDVRVVRPVCLSRCVSEEEGPPRSPTPAERDTNQAFISHSPSPPRRRTADITSAGLVISLVFTGISGIMSRICRAWK
jgi:hypothetical protein